MKTILVPVDYSETSVGAAIYACELAKLLSAKVTLFHAYHPPIPTSEYDAVLIPDIDLEKENMLLLENFKRDLSKQISLNSNIECEVKIGFAVDEIVTTALEKKVDLVVMGISGGGKVSEYVLGSNTMGVIRKSGVPMIVVPPKATFKKPAVLVFACDYKREVSAKVITSLKEYVHAFGAKLLVLNLEKPSEGVTFEKAVNGIQLENALSTTEHSLHFLPNTGDIADEMNKFIDSHDADLLITVPHHHSLLHRIFNKSITKHLAFHSHVPLLALQE